MPRILVLVLSIDREPWRTIEQLGQRRTWAAKSDADVLYYYGRDGLRRHATRVAARAGLTSSLSVRAAAAPCRLAGDRLWCDVPEVYRFTLPKLLAALRWALAHREFEYVYRTNTSSYINLDRLQVVAEGLPRERCYAGWVIRRDPDGLPFVSGGGMLMSRDVAEAFATRSDWNWGTTDDAAFGEAAAAMRLDLVPLDRVRVRTIDDVAALTEEQLATTFNYRCKTEARNDHEIMVALDRRLR